MTNTLNDLKIDLIDNEKRLKQLNQYNITIIADLINEKKLIESALKEEISGEYKVEYNDELIVIVSKRKELNNVSFFKKTS